MIKYLKFSQYGFMVYALLFVLKIPFANDLGIFLQKEIIYFTVLNILFGTYYLFESAKEIK